MRIDDIKPMIHGIEHTEVYIADQDYTYNDVRLNYNSDVYYGGLYGNPGERPKIQIEDIKP